MGNGVQPKPNQGKFVREQTHGTLHMYARMPFTFHVVCLTRATKDGALNMLIASLMILLRMQWHPAFSPVFLLNSTTYLCANLLAPHAPLL